jgi:two-component system, OmpR family, KDP operon response regulator KdpE
MNDEPANEIDDAAELARGDVDKILIVDDEPQIRKFLRISLTAHGYDVVEAATGAEGVAQAAGERPDLIILDLGLPDFDGHQVLAKIRERSQTPVIVLSVRAGEAEKVRALDGGAEDYLTKPFGIGELLARIRAALRKRRDGTEPRDIVFRKGDLIVDLGHRRVTLRGEEVKLSRKEYDILKLLVINAGRVVTHQQILSEVWGPNHLEDTHYLRIHVGHLRQKLDDDPASPSYILTEPGVGYRLATDD